ncbi:ShlB/FhaC/HecB family hemolysin secretion/activation protein [Roseitranquillus sediminis]|uniref:ShlB/FhaC/HecB family hemolysin secretion/activation protein n=1 Tax=Roseitranquillus sediminis TaxID=2809051 RepID=UPI001D0CD5EE|nr:ShlB/FhaC/HecB family hemolysin secretion/activation protein [Roseitranquillus sediminis]MBM9595916.1 ShlB/FhaC/HecB family hemolysin secretion/activation protein [Roseitranquillus sediminis]
MIVPLSRTLAFVFALCLGVLPATAQTFLIDAVAFEDSTYLSEDELQDVARRYVGRPITFPDLTEMLDDVEQLYLRRGIPTARAVIPPQEIRDGTLRVSLVEATIESVEYEGLDRTDPDFLSRTISLVPGERPDFERIATDLRIFDISHDVSPSLRFAPGTAAGTTRVTVTGEETPRWAWTVSADNFGREETGETRGSLFFRWSSVTGVRDTLSFQYQASEGASSASLGYSRPVGPAGGRVFGTLSFSESQIIGGEFADVQIESSTQAVTLGYRRAWRVRPSSHWVLEGGLSAEQSESEILGLAFADVDLTEVFGRAQHSRRFGRAALGLTFGLRVGQLEAMGTTETEGTYYLAFGGATYSRLLGERLVFDAALNAQLAPDQNLPVARLILAGGPQTVRGYPNDVRGGDSGLIANFQLSPREAWRPVAENEVEVRPFGFVDAALIVPFRQDGGINADQDYLASVGVGATLTWRDSAALLAMVGQPLIETLGFEETEPRFYVGIDFSF